MRVFVTGANGYIGAGIVAELLRRGHHVAGLARSDAAAQAVRSLGAQVVHGSLDSLDALELAAREHDATVHAGGIASPDDVAREARALDAMLAVARHGHTFVYTSGAWVYGDRGDALIEEDAPLRPVPMVAWRPAHEQKVLAAAQRGIRAIVVRPAAVYGNGRGLVGRMMAQAIPGPLRIAGDGNNRWSMVRVDALAELYAAALEQSAAGGIYNGSHGAPVPYVELARAASRAGGGDGTLEHLTLEAARAVMGPLADAYALDLHVSSARARRELGWDPHRPTVLEELANTVVP